MTPDEAVKRMRQMCPGDEMDIDLDEPTDIDGVLGLLLQVNRGRDASLGIVQFNSWTQTGFRLHCSRIVIIRPSEKQR